jgi:hypothetical protein
MSITNDNIQISSSLPSGATIGTNVVGAEQVHIQQVKINTGLDGVDNLLSDANPVNVVPSGHQSFQNLFFQVAGSTDGTTPVDVNIAGGAALTVAGITISGGTLDRIQEGVSADIRTVAGGISIGVATVGSETVTVDGTVGLGAGTNNIGDVDVLTVAIPAGTGITTAVEIANATSSALPGNLFETGFRITNFGPNTAYINQGSGTTATGYPIGKFDSLFLEATGAGSLHAICAAGETADLRIIGS